MSDDNNNLALLVGRLDATATRMESAVDRLETRVTKLEQKNTWLSGAKYGAFAVFGALATFIGWRH